MIDSNFNFQISKVYISAKATQDEINILYRRGELSPTLYQLHLSMKKNHSSIFHSNVTSSTSSSSSNTKLPGNQLQDFVYQEKTLAAFTNHQHNSSSTHSQLSEEFDILHHHSPPVPSPLSPTTSQQNHKINPAVITTSFAKLQEKERILSQLKEMLHFNRMILLKVLDYFGSYIEKQPQLKAMIVKMGTRSSSSSSALNLQQQQQQQQQLPIQESLSDQENDSSQNTSQNTSEKKKKFKLKKKSKKFDNSFYPDRDDTSINNNNANNTKKIEKKKSKVGILFYLFFLETIHQLISHLSSSSSSQQQQQLQHQQIQQQRYNYHPHPTKFTYQEEKIHEIIDICLFSYNINNHFGKLFRFLFQQAFTFLCEHHQEFLQLQNLCENDEIDNNDGDENDEEEDNNHKDDENNDTTLKNTCSEEMKRYRRYKRVINEVTHMDIILNILPFLQFEDIFQCCFLFFPSKVMSFIDHHPHPQPTPTSTTTSSSSISPGKLSSAGQSMGTSSSSLAQSSLFKNLEDVKQLIKYLFHEINQNKDYFHIANDIYDIFSYHINWDKFIKQMN